ncbi:MAG: DUF1684 domain-containing protein [Actinomycetota bacterium]|nr:DUF1684 domain-containing protein [Actinomycetota bacterium]
MLSLWDYRRRVFALYDAVRAGRGDAGTWSEWVKGRDRLFGTHPQSPLASAAQATFSGLAYFDHDPRLVFDVTVEDTEPVAAEVAHSGEGTTRLIRFGRARFTVEGEACALSLYWLDAYGGGIFLAFRDATSGEETYGGGRYLLDTVKGADLGHTGRTVRLDFNYAYHPSCVHDPRWSCPLSPPENWLDVAIRAGERLPWQDGNERA